MSEDRTDVAASDIDWWGLFGALASASDFSAMARPLYESGVLIADYRSLLDEGIDLDDIDEIVDDADLPTLRAILTSLVRDDHFSPGVGARYFWEGEFDSIVDAISERVAVPYPLPYAEYAMPRRIPPCPTCGLTDALAYRLVGMPAAPPADFDTERIVFAGCVDDGTQPDFHCRRDGTDFDFPYLSEFDQWEFDVEGARDA